VPERFTSIVDVHIILRRHGKILLLRRAGHVYASGLFCLPSGHLERGESVLDAAVRETKEETGIVLDPPALLLALSIHQRNPGGHTRIGFVFEPSQWHGEPANREPAKCSELVWASPDALPADTVAYTVAILRAVGRGDTFTLNGWRLARSRLQHAWSGNTCSGPVGYLFVQGFPSPRVLPDPPAIGSGRLRGKSCSWGPFRRWWVLICARVLPGHALYLRQRNRAAIYGKEKVYGSIP
jgi:8-oxo-dGTP pyrophosphatase MutT (NUDIX family)